MKSQDDILLEQAYSKILLKENETEVQNAGSPKLNDAQKQRINNLCRNVLFQFYDICTPNMNDVDGNHPAYDQIQEDRAEMLYQEALTHLKNYLSQPPEEFTDEYIGRTDKDEDEEFTDGMDEDEDEDEDEVVP